MPPFCSQLSSACCRAPSVLFLSGAVPVEWFVCRLFSAPRPLGLLAVTDRRPHGNRFPIQRFALPSIEFFRSRLAVVRCYKTHGISSALRGRLLCEGNTFTRNKGSEQKCLLVVAAFRTSERRSRGGATCHRISLWLLSRNERVLLRDTTRGYDSNKWRFAHSITLGYTRKRRKSSRLSFLGPQVVP